MLTGNASSHTTRISNNTLIKVDKSSATVTNNSNNNINNSFHNRKPSFGTFQSTVTSSSNGVSEGYSKHSSYNKPINTKAIKNGNTSGPKNNNDSNIDPTNDDDEENCIHNAVPSENLVFVKDDKYAWVPAIVISSDDDKHDTKVRVKTPIYPNEQSIIVVQQKHVRNYEWKEIDITISEYPNQSLPLQNVLISTGSSSKNIKNNESVTTVPDMVDLEHLHEVSNKQQTFRRRDANDHRITRIRFTSLFLIHIFHSTLFMISLLFYTI